MRPVIPPFGSEEFMTGVRNTKKLAHVCGKVFPLCLERSDGMALKRLCNFKVPRAIVPKIVRLKHGRTIEEGAQKL